VQTGDNLGSPQLIAEVDALLERARHRGDPSLIGQLLRYSALTRMSKDHTEPAAASIVEELACYATRHGLTALLAGSHALRARRLLALGAEDTALTEVALALAILDDNPTGNVIYGTTPYLRVLSNVLVDLSTLLVSLGNYEIADEMMRRAQVVNESAGDPHIETVLAFNRVMLMLDWGRRRERIGDVGGAAEHFRTAAALADRVTELFTFSMFPLDPTRTAADQLNILAAAYAYADPGAHHCARLRELMASSVRAQDVLVSALPLARCLEADGAFTEAVEVLTDVSKQIDDVPAEPYLYVSMARELARLTDLSKAIQVSAATGAYIQRLESDLWELRESRVLTLQTRREHERLARAHGTVSALAKQDPLTELPNRRALDERLASIAANAEREVCIALIDLDGFKRVNDDSSHAAGDEALRLISTTLRDALRAEDLVARYGGDEFVALFVGSSLPAAKAALRRACERVRALDRTRSQGVTMSIGVVELRRGESTSAALGRADGAMYLVKRRGGDSVLAAGEDTGGPQPPTTDT
jgi:diguanylate cyclase (GGDEF)-like protein